ncbi:MAG: 2-amino-4-hydroxy-6-hydroxymethyldihydropteridine diphosphokinase [Amylibacter sp.]|jgi:2-amino-4-hydroxy-6-hydroxymethyldihydropteridine diphosphokinase|tara:strand:+ start:15442 stop:16026 length:585 start_codon:yes stop_codon:yes gene_type:complete
MSHYNSKKILLALGSNVSNDLQDSYDLVKKSISELCKKTIKKINISNFYQTPAFPIGAGPDFINCVISAYTELDSLALLEELHWIEAKFGRKRLKRWGQRTLDIDLLDYDFNIKPNITYVQEWLNMPLGQQLKQIPNQLILPHPRLQERAFVLIPMVDVAPDWMHPILGKTTLEMRDALSLKTLNEIRFFIRSD